MHLYEVSDGGDRVSHHQLRDDAHRTARLRADRIGTRIRLFNYPEGGRIAFVCDLLNGVKPRRELLRTWALTNRGGLMEMPAATALRELEEEEAVA